MGMIVTSMLVFKRMDNFGVVVVVVVVVEIVIVVVVNIVSIVVVTICLHSRERSCDDDAYSREMDGHDDVDNNI
jgi:hypothetical protein